MNHDGGKSSFNASEWAIRHRAVVVYLIIVATLIGAFAYTRLAQSEDPPFTFRIMVIQTVWPGATAVQTQEQVTNRIERVLQELPNRDFTRSYSRPGESMIFYGMKESVAAAKVPYEWYTVRKKISDIAGNLPEGVVGPSFNDEFGDVYTSVLALHGDGYSPAQLRDQADILRTVMLRIPGVAKVDYFGEQTEVISVEIANATLAQLGIAPTQIADAISAQNAVAYTGTVITQDDKVFVRPSGQFTDEQQLADTLIHTNDRSFRLGDVATIVRDYKDPPVDQMRHRGEPVLGLGITAQAGYDVVRLGKNLDQAMGQLRASLPTGLALEQVLSMPQAVSQSVNEFLRAVGEAVAIVLIVSLVSLGLRTGAIVVISIPVVLAITALLMYWLGIGLHKVSLGTLVLALGLLVDDAIIAIEMMTVKLDQGWDKMRAAAFAYTSTAFPMLTGTLVTVAGFLPIVLAQSSTGEYTRSIFEVSAIALIVSWLAAIILIPLLGYAMLTERKDRTATDGSRKRHEVSEHDIYGSWFYTRLRSWLAWCVRQRVLVLLIAIALFAVAMVGFKAVPKQFFPNSERPELMVDLRLPESASFKATLEQVERLERYLNDHDDVADYISFVGTGAPRFYLPLDQQLPQSNFAQFVISTASIDRREALADALGSILQDDFAAVRTRISRLENGPPVGYPVQFRISGDDIPTVRQSADKVAGIMRDDGRTVDVQLDWDEPSARSLQFKLDQDVARQLGVSSRDVSNFLAMTLSGYTVSQFRENDKLIQIDLRAPPDERNDPAALMGMSMPTAAGPVPLAALGEVKPALEYGVIWERDRQPTITVRSDVRAGVEGIDVTHDIERQIQAVRAQLPLGYRIEVGGAVEESGKGQSSIMAQMPIMVVVVLTLLMMQLHSFTRVLIVVFTAPFGLIGVVATLLLFNKPFGFVAMLGVIAMFGIIMRNSVILIDQIEQDIAAGHARLDAIIDATVRRFRPIVLTAAVSVLALIPLLRSNFFGPMATALMGGISSATILTIFVVPALYALVYRVRADERADSAATGAAEDTA